MDLSLQVARGGPTVIGSVLRSAQAYLELTCLKHTLEWGVAFHSPDYPHLPTLSEFREVWIERRNDAPHAVAAVQEHFRALGAPEPRWTLAEAQDAGIIESTLMAAGYQRDDRVAVALSVWPTAPPPAGIRVLPARPMRQVYRTIALAAGAALPSTDAESFANAALDRLDDQRMDMFVALSGDAPAGMGGLLQVGDLGLVVDLYVHPDHRGRGVAPALLGHVAALARRVAMRVVGLEVSVADQAAIRVLERCGYVPAGRIISYRPAHPGEAGQPG